LGTFARIGSFLLPELWIFPKFTAMENTISPAMAELLGEIETFVAAHEMSETAFGKEAASDPNFIKDLRNGREIRWKTEQRVRSYMETGLNAVAE
jgi:hypothetical protein